MSGRRGGGAGRCPGRLGLGPTFRMGRGRRQRQRRGRDAGPSPPGRAGAGAKRERLPEPEQKQEHRGAEPLQSRAGPEPDSACLCPCPCLCPCLGLEHCRRERAACNHPCNRVRRAGGNPNPGRPWPGLERASLEPAICGGHGGQRACPGWRGLPGWNWRRRRTEDPIVSDLAQRQPKLHLASAGQRCPERRRPDPALGHLSPQVVGHPN